MYKVLSDTDSLASTVCTSTVTGSVFMPIFRFLAGLFLHFCKLIDRVNGVFYFFYTNFSDGDPYNIFFVHQQFLQYKLQKKHNRSFYILSCFPIYFLCCLFVPQFLNEEINIFVGTVYIVIPVEGTRGIANMTDRRAGQPKFFLASRHRDSDSDKKKYEKY